MRNESASNFVYDRHSMSGVVTKDENNHPVAGVEEDNYNTTIPLSPVKVVTTRTEEEIGVLIGPPASR